MVAEIWVSVISSFVDQLVALKVNFAWGVNSPSQPDNWQLDTRHTASVSRYKINCLPLNVCQTFVD